VHPDIQKLLELQKVDQKIAYLTRDLKSLPQEQEKRQRQLDQVLGARDAKKAEVEQAELRGREIELGIKQSDEEILKLNERLNTVKNNAEYQATLFQIESVKRDRDQTEEEGLMLLEKQQALKVELEERDKEAASAQAVFEAFLAEAEKVREESETKTVEIAAQRKGVAEDVPPELLATYERLFDVRDQLAVCPVEGNICQGCYTAVTTQYMAKLQGGKSVVQCDACQRFLYIP